MGFRIFISFLFFLAVYIFRFYIRYIELTDYIFCYACHEMDTVKMPYDYIVVGLGSAGSVVARRLAEDKNAKILVLEAGAYSNSLLHIPVMSLLLQKSNFDWQYITTPQKRSCKAFPHRTSTWPMGKTVGGTHMLNNMIYTRGHPSDYAEWYKYVKGYSYENDILLYFKRLENAMNDTNSNIEEGSTVITDPPFLSSLADHVLKAFETMKLPILDSTLTAQEGFGTPKATVFEGSRWTTADHLLNLNKENILIRTQVTVKKVLFKKNYEAYGVKYLYLNDYYFARAKKAVILCAGVIGSPKILMLSGIGPSEHLESVGVTPIVNLPVGNNLQDHITTGLDLVLLNNASLDLTLEALMHPYSMYEYFVNAAGPWTTIGCDVLGYLSETSLDRCRCSCFLEENRTPDVQFMVLPVGVTVDYGSVLKSLIGIKKNVWKSYFRKVTNTTTISIVPVLLHPKSRGTVRLKSSNVYSQPLINPNYLSDPYDIGMLIKGIEFIKKIIETDPMQQLGATLNRNIFPGCEKYDFDTKRYWECYIRHVTLTSYHPVGTCKMGEGISTVVDFNFKVRGTNKLFVIDGSVMPSLVSGNVNGAIIMLAEKGAEAVKYQDYLNNFNCDAKEVFVPKCTCDMPVENYDNIKPNSRYIIC